MSRGASTNRIELAYTLFTTTTTVTTITSPTTVASTRVPAIAIIRASAVVSVVTTFLPHQGRQVALRSGIRDFARPHT